MDWIARARFAVVGLLLFLGLPAVPWGLPSAHAESGVRPPSEAFRISIEDQVRKQADEPVVADPVLEEPAESTASAEPDEQEDSKAREPAKVEPAAGPKSSAKVNVSVTPLAGPAPSLAESSLTLQPVEAFAPQKFSAPRKLAEDKVVASNVELPWGPTMPSPELDAIAQRAEATSRQGFNLAERGALYTARARFIEALRSMAQALDAQRNTNAHTKALAAGLRAIEEVDDFVPTGDRLETDLNFQLIVDAHRTSILKDRDLSELTAAQAQRAYLTYAQEQLAAAGSDQGVSSLALHGLGKICGAPAEMHGPRVHISDAKAITFYQAALIVDPQNFLAANELGVLLARCGRLDDARLALEHAVAYSRAPTPLRNLAAVYHRIGEPQRAILIRSEFQRAAEQLANAGHAGAGQKYPIDWVEPEVFSRRHSMINSPPQSEAIAPANMSQADARSQTLFRR